MCSVNLSTTVETHASVVCSLHKSLLLIIINTQSIIRLCEISKHKLFLYKKNPNHDKNPFSIHHYPIAEPVRIISMNVSRIGKSELICFTNFGNFV